MSLPDLTPLAERLQACKTVLKRAQARVLAERADRRLDGLSSVLGGLFSTSEAEAAEMEAQTQLGYAEQAARQDVPLWVAARFEALLAVDLAAGAKLVTHREHLSSLSVKKQRIVNWLEWIGRVDSLLEQTARRCVKTDPAASVGGSPASGFISVVARAVASDALSSLMETLARLGQAMPRNIREGLSSGSEDSALKSTFDSVQDILRSLRENALSMTQAQCEEARARLATLTYKIRKMADEAQGQIEELVKLVAAIEGPFRDAAIAELPEILRPYCEASSVWSRHPQRGSE